MEKVAPHRVEPTWLRTLVASLAAPSCFARAGGEGKKERVGGGEG